MFKRILISLMSVAIIGSLSLGICAAEVTAPQEKYITISSGTTITPYADDIGWVYRQNGNIIEGRRWNYTRGEWYDPYWIYIRDAA